MVIISLLYRKQGRLGEGDGVLRDIDKDCHVIYQAYWSHDPDPGEYIWDEFEKTSINHWTDLEDVDALTSFYKKVRIWKKTPIQILELVHSVYISQNCHRQNEKTKRITDAIYIYVIEISKIEKYVLANFSFHTHTVHTHANYEYNDDDDDDHKEERSKIKKKGENHTNAFHACRMDEVENRWLYPPPTFQLINPPLPPPN